MKLLARNYNTYNHNAGSYTSDVDRMQETPAGGDPEQEQEQEQEQEEAEAEERGGDDAAQEKEKEF